MIEAVWIRQPGQDLSDEKLTLKDNLTQLSLGGGGGVFKITRLTNENTSGKIHRSIEKGATDAEENRSTPRVHARKRMG